MNTNTTEAYSPEKTRLLTFHDHVPSFLDGSDTPRAYLERCLALINEREPEVMAFARMNIEGARAAADASTERYAQGKPLSAIDGMPVGVKDVIETKDMLTESGSPLFEGNMTGQDAAVVEALRRAGAVIVGKTVTTEFAFYNPGPTRNPFDLSRTPGGSSSGSGAAVGAGFLPAAIGTQVVGSLIRPSSFNANFGYKPSFGAINGNGVYFHHLSQTVLGAHAGSLTDAWVTARTAAELVGGDAGYAGLNGPLTLPEAKQPTNLARLETLGWERCEPEVRARFDAAMDVLTQAGLNLLSRKNNVDIEAFEQTMEPALDVTNNICGYELLWPLKQYDQRGPDAISENIRSRLREWEKIDRPTYARLLDERAKLRAAHKALEGKVSAFVTLSATGAAPKGLATTGDPIFAVTSSVLGAPAINLPLLEIDGMPLGFQVVGYPGKDAELFSIAHWILNVFGRDV